MSTGVKMIDAAARVPHEQFMRQALECARRSLLAGEPPIGACIVSQGEVVATAGNSVIANLDSTAHAEMLAIREACGRLRKLTLEDCQIYTTVEPCAMCLAACHYSGIATIFFGASLEDMQKHTGTELAATNCATNTDEIGVSLIGECLRAESLALLDEWSLQRQAGTAS